MKRTLKWLAISLVGLLVVGQFFFSLPPSIQTNLNQRKSEAFLAEIESALSRFHIDNGYYPENKEDPIDGGSVLYDTLVEGDRAYLEAAKNGEFTRAYAGRWYLIDYWGDPIRYRSFPMGTPPDQRDTNNSTYDLWSTGSSPQDRERWITNWRE